MVENTPSGWLAGFQQAAIHSPNPLHRRMSSIYAQQLEADMQAGKMPRTAEEAGISSPDSLEEKSAIPHSMFFVDPNSREITVKASQVTFHLTRREFDIEQILQANCGKFLRTGEFRTIFQERSVSRINDALKIHIRRIRRKFHENGILMDGYPVGLIESGKDSGTRDLGYRMLDPELHTPLNSGAKNDKEDGSENAIISSHSRLVLNPNTRELKTKSDTPKGIMLTQTELKIYLVLLQNTGKYMRAKDFVSVFDGYEVDEIMSNVRVYIRRIRKKFLDSEIIEVGFPLGYIDSHKSSGLGYRVIDPEAEEFEGVDSSILTQENTGFVSTL